MQALEIEEAEFEEDTKMFQALRALDDPWFEGYGTKGGVWEKKVVGALRTKTLGRFVFGMLLSYIKNQVARVHEGAMEALGALGKEIQAWDCEADQEKQLERNFLLKELRIGRRAQELPTWAGLVNTKRGVHVFPLSPEGAQKWHVKLWHKLLLTGMSDMCVRMAYVLAMPDM